MNSPEIEELKYQLAKEATLNFFAGNHSIVFDALEEKKEFFRFIKNYDERYAKKFEELAEVKEVAWIYSFTSYRHQLEWIREEDANVFKLGYFYAIYGRYAGGYEPIKYEVVRPYIIEYLGAKSKLAPFIDNIKMAIEKGFEEENNNEETT